MPLPYSPVYHCKARASLCSDLPIRHDSADNESHLVSSAYQIRSKLWLCVTKFDLLANTPTPGRVVSVDDQPDLPDRICAHRARRWHDLARYLRCESYRSLKTTAQYYPVAKYLEGFLHYVCL